MTSERTTTGARHFRTIEALTGAWAALLAAGWGIGHEFAGTTPGWDVSVLHWVHGGARATPTTAMRDITALASPLVLDLVFLGAIVALLIRRRLRDVLYLLLSAARASSRSRR